VFTKDFVNFEDDHDITPKGFAGPCNPVLWHGRYLLPYTSYPLAPSKLCYSESKDLEQWGKPIVFLDEARHVPWNTHKRAIDPTFVADGDTLHCFFIGSCWTETKGRHANLMGHAVTTDPELKEWKILTPGKPLIGRSKGPSSSDYDGAENLTVFKTGNQWTMIYSEGLVHQHIAYAQSPDLTHWTLHGPVRLPVQNWMKRKHGGPLVWREKDYWVMILMGTAEDNRTRFGLLTSDNGVDWSPLPEKDATMAAPKPLYRDPVYDGAADPVVIWNRGEEKWFMLYTNRRANVPGLRGVSWVHGTRIGVAESSDGGVTWNYRGTADIRLGGPDDSHWAPEVVWHEGVYHMYLSLVPGMHEDWSGQRFIHHLVSKDLLAWTDAGRLPLSSDRVIDACVFRMPDGTWRMWYKDERDGQQTHYADSADLHRWTNHGRAITSRACEGPTVMQWHGNYWMVVDEWRGLAVYRSDDARNWERQPGNILAQPGKGEEEQVMGGHASLMVNNDRAWLFYFTHPGRRGPDKDKDTTEQRRSSLQVVELEFQDGWLVCDRDRPATIQLIPPTNDE
jgi:sucrose-6-phosphate hydrolase SacC (GH32 family)